MRRVLSFDPGAQNMGWAVLKEGDPPIYVTSGVKSLPKFDGEKFQPYKMRVIREYSAWGLEMWNQYKPGALVAEIIPPRGFERSVQNQLAQAAITAIFAVLYNHHHGTVAQVSATTVKKAIGGSGKASKVRVRNGVLQVFPELRPRIKEWVKKFDEPDAIAIGLTYLGIQVK